MTRLVRLALVRAALAVGVLPAWAAAPEVNLLAFTRGALIESVTSTYDGAWDAIWLLDENPATGWASEQNVTLPVSIVISLPERSELRRFVFNTADAETDDRTAREVDILVSDVSPRTGFNKVGGIVLAPRKDGQDVTLAMPATGRWVMLTIRSTNGSAEYVEIMDVQGFGVPLAHIVPSGLSGTYDSDQYGRMHLRQDGAAVTGCYETKGGLVEGGLDGSLLRLRWREDGGGTGPALMALSRDGKVFRGMWRTEGESGWHGDWDPRKISDEVGSCPHWKPGDGANPVLAGLKGMGRASLDGLVFGPEGDTLRSELQFAIDRIVAALKANPGWTVSLESHVEATGIPEDDRDLSQRRAEAVKAAVVAGGIDPARLAAEGKGADQPAAGNETGLNRALNRRVEIVRR